MTEPGPGKRFKTGPGIIRMAVRLDAWFPLALRSVEDLLHERGIDISHEAIRFRWHRNPVLYGAIVGYPCSRTQRDEAG
jgi:putative transposase